MRCFTRKSSRWASLREKVLHSLDSPQSICLVLSLQGLVLVTWLQEVASPLGFQKETQSYNKPWQGVLFFKSPPGFAVGLMLAFDKAQNYTRTNVGQTQPCKQHEHFENLNHEWWLVSGSGQRSCIVLFKFVLKIDYFLLESLNILSVIAAYIIHLFLCVVLATKADSYCNV